jgi:hypothetical protein
VDARDILDREAHELGEDWPAFWAGVEAAAVRRDQLGRLDRACAQLRQQVERHRQQLREATGTPTEPAPHPADRPAFPAIR